MTDCRFPACSCERAECDATPSRPGDDLGRIVDELRRAALAMLAGDPREPYHVRADSLRWACTPERILRLCDAADGAIK